MTLKEIIGALTSVKGLIVGAVLLTATINELRLTVKIYELKESSTEILNEGFENLKKEAARVHKTDSIHMAEIITDLSMKSGIVIDYSLIRDNTAEAVSNGFDDAIAHN
jgi:hypothetical protein